MPLPGFYKYGSARMERGTILICIFSIFIFVQDVPYYNHAAGSKASMILGKILALISLRGVVSSSRLHGVVIDTTLLATGSSYGKIPALTSRGVIISSQMNGAFLHHGSKVLGKWARGALDSTLCQIIGSNIFGKWARWAMDSTLCIHMGKWARWAIDLHVQLTPHCAKLSVVSSSSTLHTHFG